MTDDTRKQLELHGTQLGLRREALQEYIERSLPPEPVAPEPKKATKKKAKKKASKKS